jgi:hypothetical protein
LTFTGDLWVHDSTFAIRKINLRLAEDANINFINDLVISQNYELINKQNWMLTKEKMTVDFNVIENSKRTLGFYGHKSTTYKNFVFNTPKENKFYSSPVNVIVEDNSDKKDAEFWKNNRHESLDKKENGIYKMVDSLKNVKMFRTYEDIIKTILYGYYIRGNFEYGPYLETFSFNKIEGNRFKFGMRTSNKFSTTIMPQAYVAYGTLDGKIKYGGGFLYMFSKNPRRDLGIYYKNDFEQLGESKYSFYNDNILASFLRRSPFNKLTMAEEYHGFYEHEWFNGLTNTLHFYRRSILPPVNSQFSFKPDISNTNININPITTSEIRLDAR